MTREEAREILTHNWTRVDNPNYSESELDEAFFMAIEALSSADNERPTVIKCRISMLPEDFKVWAERIRKNNPSNNIVVIPYDAEYVSGEERVEECE